MRFLLFIFTILVLLPQKGSPSELDSKKPSSAAFLSKEKRDAWWKAVASRASESAPLPGSENIITFKGLSGPDKSRFHTPDLTSGVTDYEVAPMELVDKAGKADIEYHMYVPRDFYDHPEIPRPVVFRIYGYGLLQFSSNSFLYQPRVLASMGCIVIELRGEALPTQDVAGGGGLRYNYTNFPEQFFEDIRRVKEILSETSEKGGLYKDPYIRDGSKVFVLGESFGGYFTTLMATWNSPFNELFDGYIVHAAVYDWKQRVEDYPSGSFDYKSFDFKRSTNQNVFHSTFLFGENYLTNADYLARITPTSRVKDLKRPVLIYVGAKDINTLGHQAYDFVMAARRAGTAGLVQIHTFKNAGHYVPDNLTEARDYYEAMLDFMANIMDNNPRALRERKEETDGFIANWIQEWKLERLQHLLEALNPKKFDLKTTLMNQILQDCSTPNVFIQIPIVPILRRVFRGHDVPLSLWQSYLKYIPPDSMSRFLAFTSPDSSLRDRYVNFEKRITDLQFTAEGNEPSSYWPQKLDEETPLFVDIKKDLSQQFEKNPYSFEGALTQLAKDFLDAHPDMKYRLRFVPEKPALDQMVLMTYQILALLQEKKPDLAFGIVGDLIDLMALGRITREDLVFGFDTRVASQIPGAMDIFRKAFKAIALANQQTSLPKGLSLKFNEALVPKKIRPHVRKALHMYLLALNNLERLQKVYGKPAPNALDQIKNMTLMVQTHMASAPDLAHEIAEDLLDLIISGRIWTTNVIYNFSDLEVSKIPGARAIFQEAFQAIALATKDQSLEERFPFYIKRAPKKIRRHIQAALRMYVDARHQSLLN